MDQDAKKMRQEIMQTQKLQKMMRDKDDRIGEQQARISELTRDVVQLRESNEEMREKVRYAQQQQNQGCDTCSMKDT